jgi:hypothetical protein
MTTVFTPLKVGFTWVDPVANSDGSALYAGELTGYTLGIRPDGSAPVNVNTGTYPLLVLIPSPVATAESKAALLAALSSVPPGNYWGSIRAESLNGPSAWAAEDPFALLSTAAPVPPTGFMVA